MIRFACPKCNAMMEAPAHKAGEKIGCLKCGQRLQIPSPPRQTTVLAKSIPLPSKAKSALPKPPTIVPSTAGVALPHSRKESSRLPWEPYVFATIGFLLGIGALPAAIVLSFNALAILVSGAGAFISLVAVIFSLTRKSGFGLSSLSLTACVVSVFGATALMGGWTSMIYFLGGEPGPNSSKENLSGVVIASSTDSGSKSEDGPKPSSKEPAENGTPSKANGTTTVKPQMVSPTPPTEEKPTKDAKDFVAPETKPADTPVPPLSANVPTQPQAPTPGPKKTEPSQKESPKDSPFVAQAVPMPTPAEGKKAAFEKSPKAAVVTQATVPVAGSQKEKDPLATEPGPLPPALRLAWENAGFVTSSDSLGSSIERPYSLTSFRWPRTRNIDGVIVTLPSPDQRFALVLAGPSVTDSTMNELANLMHLQRLSLTGTNVTGDGLRRLKGLLHMEWVGFGFEKGMPINKNVNDLTLKGVSDLRHLRGLSLTRTDVTDAGLRELAGMKLKSLDIPAGARTWLGLKNYLAAVEPVTTLNLGRLGPTWGNGQVNDQILKELVLLKELQSLTRLSLKGTMVTDLGLKELARLPNLAYLDIEATGLTNSGLGALVELKQLRELYIGGTRLTPAGLDLLRQSLPDCRIDTRVNR